MKTPLIQFKLRHFRQIAAIGIFTLFSTGAANAWDCNTDCREACTSEWTVWVPFPMPGRWVEKSETDPFCYQGCLAEKRLDCSIGSNSCAVYRAEPLWNQLRLAMKEAKREGVLQSESQCYQLAGGGSLAAKVVKFVKDGEGPLGEVAKHMGDCACSSIDWSLSQGDDDGEIPSVPGIWRRKPGLATRVAANDRGHAYALGYPVGSFGHTLYRWTGDDWARTSGQGVRVAVDTNGSPWVVNNRNEIWYVDKNTRSFVRLDVAAVDIGIGANGTFYILSTQTNQFGNLVYRYENDRWVGTGGAGIRLAVDANGRAIVVNKQGKIYRHVAEDRWIDLNGTGHDVAVAGGRIFAIGTNQANVGYGIWVMSGPTSWESFDGAGTSITGGNNRIWVTNSLGHIYRRKISSTR